MAEAWGYTPEAVADASGFSDQQRKEFGDVILADAPTGGSLCLKQATAYAADTVRVTRPVSTEPTLELYGTGEPISIEEELASIERYVDWQRGREVSDMATEVLLFATGDQPQPDAEDVSTFRNLANKGNSCLQDLLQLTQHGSPGSRTSSLESLGSDLDQVITDYNWSFKYANRAALDRAVQDVRINCLTPAVRAAKPREVWVLEHYETIMKAFKPMQRPGV